MKLSIITPVYNTPIPLLKEMLESVQKSQIKYPYEHIIINDGSTETKLVDFLYNISAENIKVYHKYNEGVSVARNFGLEKSIGDFIICLDADDILLPKINDAIKFLEDNTEYSIVYCDIEYFGDIKGIYKTGHFSKIKQIYFANQMAVTTLFRREIINNFSFNKNFKYAEDWDFWARIASNGYNFKYFNDRFFKYRKLKNGKSFSQIYYSEKESTLQQMKLQFNPHKEITLKEVNLFVINNFKDNKKHLIKLFLILFFPKIFNFLYKKRIYKNNIVID